VLKISGSKFYCSYKKNLLFQDKRFEQEKMTLLRTYESDLDTLVRQQRQQVEKAEIQQDVDLRVSSKKIRAEQERELKQFRDGLKQELRLLKQEVDLMPKDKRKNMFRARKEKLETDHEDRVSTYGFLLYCINSTTVECSLEL